MAVPAPDPSAATLLAMLGALRQGVRPPASPDRGTPLLRLAFRLAFLSLAVRRGLAPGLDEVGWAPLLDRFAALRAGRAGPRWATGLWAADRLAELEASGVDRPHLVEAWRAAADLDDPAEVAHALPWLLDPAASGGEAGDGRRKSRGAWYTPAPVVDGVLVTTLRCRLDEVAAGHADGPPRLVDPACGGGAFLLGALRLLRDHQATAGLDGHGWLRSLHGVDDDPLAVELCRMALWFDLAGSGSGPSTGRLVDLAEVDAQVVWADSLLPAASGPGPEPAADDRPGAAPGCAWTAWAPEIFDRRRGEAGDRWWPGGFDVVVGNPPFRNQLRHATRDGRTRATALRRRWGDVARAYAGPHAAFTALAVELARPEGGRVGLVLPLSALATRDGGPARQRALAAGALVDLWVAPDPLFDADVAVCAPTVRTGHTPVPVRRRVGAGFTDAGVGTGGSPAGPGPWSPLVADLFGIPSVVLGGDEAAGGCRLGDVAHATADFRDQYYALVPLVREAGPDDAGGTARVVTVGLVEPARLCWGTRPTTIGRARWQAPVVDRVALADDPVLGAWADQRLVPKVLVATQSRVLEAVVDEHGDLVPSVPVLTVVPRSIDLWELAAVLLSPAATAWLAARALGTALTPGTLKVRAEDLRALPLPPPGPDRVAAGGAVRRAGRAAAAGDAAAWRAALVDAGRATAGAYGLGPATADELERWWAARLPRWR